MHFIPFGNRDRSHSSRHLNDFKTSNIDDVQSEKVSHALFVSSYCNAMRKDLLMEKGTSDEDFVAKLLWVCVRKKIRSTVIELSTDTQIAKMSNLLHANEHYAL